MKEFDLEREECEFKTVILKGVKVARNNNMNLTKFKTDIMNLFSITNDEDQWVFDYQSFLGSISNGSYITPMEWGKSYFNNRI